MDIHVNDILKMKKPHPCGSQEWLVLRVGMDFKLRCQGCGHEVMLPRSKAEKNIRKVYRDGSEMCIRDRPWAGQVLWRSVWSWRRDVPAKSALSATQWWRSRRR